MILATPTRSLSSPATKIEEALRRDLGLELLERLWSRNQMPEEDAMALAIEAQRATSAKSR